MTDNNGSDNGRDAHGRFGVGNPGKPKGSSKNKLRDEIKSFLNESWKEFPTWFKDLKPKEKIEVMLNLMPYAVSRLQTISQGDDEGNEFLQPPSIDYSALSESTLKEILKHTTISQNENNH